MKPDVFLCKSHPDFHIPADVDVGAGFDGEAYARRLKDCGADAVAFFAKCHYGHSYYYTRVGNRHPRLKMDMLAEVVRGCRKAGIGIVVYYSVFLDTAAVRLHPDWRVQAQRTGTHAGFDSARYSPVCVNSPYGAELLIPQAREIAAGYDVDELLYDTMTGFNPCYCEHCRRLFGEEIPSGPQDANWLRYVKWYADAYDNFFLSVARAVHEVKPDIAVTFNWEWGFRRPTPPPPEIDRLIADLIPTGTMACMQTRYFAGTGYPYDYMTGRFLHGLGDWNSSTLETLRYTAATTVANGGGFYIIDRQLPDGSLEERAYGAMRDVFGWLQERRQYLVGARHVPQIGVLYAYSHVMGPDLRYFPDPEARKERMKTFEGAVRLFMEHGRHFTVLNAENMTAHAAEYPLVLVPEQEHLSAAVKGALRDYVQGGGRMLITQAGEPDTVDADMLALAGVRYEGHGELDYGYFDLEPPLLTRGRFARVAPEAGTDPLLWGIRPMRAGDGGKSFGHGYAPPTVRDDRPLVTARRLGKGEVVYVASPLLKSYLNYQDPRIAALLLSLVDRLLPEPVARIKTRAQVEMSVMRRGDDLLLHLVNHSGKERLGNSWYPVTEYIPEIRDIEVSIRSATPLPVQRVPRGERMATEQSGGYMRLRLPALHVMESLLVPSYFADRHGK